MAFVSLCGLRLRAAQAYREQHPRPFEVGDVVHYVGIKDGEGMVVSAVARERVVVEDHGVERMFFKSALTHGERPAR